MLKNLLERIPYLRYAAKYRKNCSNHQPGHFYSPVMSIDEISSRSQLLWPEQPSLEGIDLQEPLQLLLFGEFLTYLSEAPIPYEKEAHARYYFNNPAFPYPDALALYGMISHYKPKRIIEVGSGHSSGLMVDINQQRFNNAINLTFIEPYPDYALYKILSPADRERVTVHEMPVQDVALELFGELEENDILFIDNSHVSKTGSDVNHVFFEILPRLRKGVLVHIHDIFYPFIYPRDWIFEHRLNWNEIYLLRAFLTYNSAFETRFFIHYLQMKHASLMTGQPGLQKPGGSFWMQKTI